MGENGDEEEEALDGAASIGIVPRLVSPPPYTMWENQDEEEEGPDGAALPVPSSAASELLQRVRPPDPPAELTTTPISHA